jgi:hypothetical protein
MNATQWPDAVRRGVRTFVQSFIGIFLATVSSAHIVSANGIPHLSTLESAVLAAAWGALIAVLAMAQNYLEDQNVIPAVLKAPPSPGADPVPKP